MPTWSKARFLLLAAGALGPACGRAEAETAPPAPPAPAVSVAPVLSQELHDSAEFTGRMEASENVEIRPRVAGAIDSVHFEEGALVRRGQLLFQIDPRPFRAEVSRRKAELERAKSEHAIAASDHERGKRLIAQNVISEQEAERLQSVERASRATWDAAAAALDAAQLELEFSAVHSPIAGRVSRALIRPGNLVSSQSLLTTVVSVDPIQAYFDVDEQSYLALRGPHAPVFEGRGVEHPVFLGLIDEQGYPHAGQLDFLDNRVDPGAGTLRVRAVFPNRDGQLTPGLFARIKLVSPESHHRVLIAERAVGTDLGKKFVLALSADDTLEYRAVKLGSSLEGLRVVQEGLNPGDVVVVNGLSHVRAGMKVSPTRTAMVGSAPKQQQVAALDAPTAAAPTAKASGAGRQP